MVRKVVAILALVVGMGLLIGGLAAFTMAKDGQAEVHKMLAAEKIEFSTGEDGKDAALLKRLGRQDGEKVVTGEQAKDYADVIAYHVAGMTDGKTYAEMDRKDPTRDTVAKAAALRTSLLSAYGAEKEAQLGMFVGLAFAGVGLVFAASGAASFRQE